MATEPLGSLSHDNGTTTMQLTNGRSTQKSSERLQSKDFIDVETVRACFPGLPAETALFNNASGTVVLKDAINRCVDETLMFR